MSHTDTPSPAMRAALQSAEDFSNPTHHLCGRSSWAAWVGTRRALIRRGWLTRNNTITDAGQEALDR